MPREAKSPAHADAELLGLLVEMAQVSRRQTAMQDPVAWLPPGDPRREDAWARIMALEPQWRAAAHAASAIPARTWDGLRAKARAVRVMVPSPRAGFPASAVNALLRSVLDDVLGEADDGRARPADADTPDPGQGRRGHMAEIEAACDPEVERRKGHPAWPEGEPFPLTPLEAWYVMQGWEVKPKAGLTFEQSQALPGELQCGAGWLRLRRT